MVDSLNDHELLSISFLRRKMNKKKKRNEKRNSTIIKKESLSQALVRSRLEIVKDSVGAPVQAHFHHWPCWMEHKGAGKGIRHLRHLDEPFVLG